MLKKLPIFFLISLREKFLSVMISILTYKPMPFYCIVCEFVFPVSSPPASFGAVEQWNLSLMKMKWNLSLMKLLLKLIETYHTNFFFFFFEGLYFFWENTNWRLTCAVSVWQLLYTMLCWYFYFLVGEEKLKHVLLTCHASFCEH